jgi:hypothetical protein
MEIERTKGMYVHYILLGWLSNYDIQILEIATPTTIIKKQQSYKPQTSRIGLGIETST